MVAGVEFDTALCLGFSLGGTLHRLPERSKARRRNSVLCKDVNLYMVYVKVYIGLKRMGAAWEEL
jgi:hypothetical protein